MCIFSHQHGSASNNNSDEYIKEFDVVFLPLLSIAFTHRKHLRGLSFENEIHFVHLGI